MYGISNNDNILIGVGRSGMIQTSSDGTIWFSRTSGVSSNIYGITNNNDIFVIFGTYQKLSSFHWAMTSFQKNVTIAVVKKKKII